jgi:peptide/nickel transport system permease protein
MDMATELSILPGTAIFLVVLALNFLGDGLRDALDPRLRSDAFSYFLPLPAAYLRYERGEIAPLF